MFLTEEDRDAPMGVMDDPAASAGAMGAATPGGVMDDPGAPPDKKGNVMAGIMGGLGSYMSQLPAFSPIHSAIAGGLKASREGGNLWDAFAGRTSMGGGAGGAPEAPKMPGPSEVAQSYLNKGAGDFGLLDEDEQLKLRLFGGTMG